MRHLAMSDILFEQREYYLPRAIGFHGHARSGKDTAARFLVDNWGYQRIAFADPIKWFLWYQNPLVGSHYRIQDIVHQPDAYDDWEQAKENREVRTLLQKTGTEAGRYILGESVWADHGIKRAQRDRLSAFTDIRFDNEILAIRNRFDDTFLVKILRDDAEPDEHVSEALLPDKLFTYVISNNETIDELHAQIGQIVDEALRNPYRRAA